MEYDKNNFVTQIFLIIFLCMLLQIGIEMTLLGDKIYKFLKFH